MNIEDWKRKNAHPKRYTHFDKRVALRTVRILIKGLRLERYGIIFQIQKK
jgi:hypothetical protein